jgi:hypothetical protein
VKRKRLEEGEGVQDHVHLYASCCQLTSTGSTSRWQLGLQDIGRTILLHRDPLRQSLQESYCILKFSLAAGVSVDLLSHRSEPISNPLNGASSSVGVPMLLSSYIAYPRICTAFSLPRHWVSQNESR